MCVKEKDKGIKKASEIASKSGDHVFAKLIFFALRWSPLVIENKT